MDKASGFVAAFGALKEDAGSVLLFEKKVCGSAPALIKISVAKYVPVDYKSIANASCFY